MVQKEIQEKKRALEYMQAAFGAHPEEAKVPRREAPSPRPQTIMVEDSQHNDTEEEEEGEYQ